MNEVINAIFTAAFQVWDKCLEVAVGFFSASPRNQGDLYPMARAMFNVVIGCTVPLASLFFIIAIYKTVLSTPPDQALKKFLADTLKYIMVVFIASQLWSIMEGIITFSDSFMTSAIPSMRYERGITEVDQNFLLNEVNNLEMDLEGADVMDFGETIKQFFDQMGPYILYFMGGIISLLLLVASGITIIGISYQRIIRPLVIMPFSAVVLGISCCSEEGEKMMWSLGKSFLGFCLSGAFMVLAITMGTILSDHIMREMGAGVGVGGSLHVIMIMVKADMSAILITGLLKSMDSMMTKVFG